MVWVNLLPWRERQLAARRRRWLVTLLAMTATGGALLLMFYLHLSAEQRRWQQQIFQQQTALAQADALAQQLAQAQQLHQALLARQQRQHHQQQRNQRWHQFMQALPQLMPDSLWLTRFTQAQSMVQLSGISEQLSDVDVFRQQLLTQPLLQQVSTGNIERQAGGALQFSLRAALQEDAGDE